MNEASKPSAGFSDDTEILTRSQGWLRFDRLTVFDEVATRTLDREFRWEHPERIASRPYSGTMLWFRSQVFNLLVVPEHPMLVKRREKTDRVVNDIPEIKAATWFTGTPRRATNWDIPLVSAWKGFAPEVVVIPAAVRAHGRHHPAPELRFPAEVWMRFLGWFLSEGCLPSDPNARNVINIAQTKPDHKPEIEATLAAMGMHWYYMQQGYQFHHGPLAERLRRECSTDPRDCKSYTKCIPPDEKAYPSELLAVLVDALMKGDGNTDERTGLRRYTTTSLRLADDLVEVLQKANCQGWTYKYRPPKPRHRQAWRVTERPGLAAKVPVPKPIRYKGIIHSVQVANAAVYVRRKGRTTWAVSA